MIRFIVRRIAYMVITVWGVTVVIFLLIHLIPGDAAVALLGTHSGNAKALAEMRQYLGLDEPIYIQYGRWLVGILHGDFGYSSQLGTPVADVLRQKVTNSLILLAGSAALMFVVGVPVGIVAALRRHGWFDRLSMFLSLVVGSMPVFWLGLLLLYFLALTYPIFPASGMHSFQSSGGGLLDLLRHLVLPSITTAAISLAIVARVVRSNMVDILGAPYMLALRARGIPARRRILRHAFKNILPPVINMSGLQVGWLFGGAVFTEIIFSWPGVGLQLFTSIAARDIPMVLGTVMVIAVIFVVANVIADIVTVLVDPVQRADL